MRIEVPRNPVWRQSPWSLMFWRRMSSSICGIRPLNPLSISICSVMVSRSSRTRESIVSLFIISTFVSGSYKNSKKSVKMYIENRKARERLGWIEVICGSMFSGKTEELIRRLKRARIARQRVEIFKPLGFHYVTLDLEGYRQGAMNEVLGLKKNP